MCLLQGLLADMGLGLFAALEDEARRPAKGTAFAMAASCPPLMESRLFALSVSDLAEPLLSDVLWSCCSGWGGSGDAKSTPACIAERGGEAFWGHALKDPSEWRPGLWASSPKNAACSSIRPTRLRASRQRQLLPNNIHIAKHGRMLTHTEPRPTVSTVRACVGRPM